MRITIETLTLAFALITFWHLKSAIRKLRGEESAIERAIMSWLEVLGFLILAYVLLVLILIGT